MLRQMAKKEIESFPNHEIRSFSQSSALTACDPFAAQFIPGDYD